MATRALILHRRHPHQRTCIQYLFVRNEQSWTVPSTYATTREEAVLSATAFVTHPNTLEFMYEADDAWCFCVHEYVDLGSEENEQQWCVWHDVLLLRARNAVDSVAWTHFCSGEWRHDDDHGAFVTAYQRVPHAYETQTYLLGPAVDTRDGWAKLALSPPDCDPAVDAVVRFLVHAPTWECAAIHAVDVPVWFTLDDEVWTRNPHTCCPYKLFS